MVRDSVDECFRLLRLDHENRARFRQAAIEGLEYQKTYHRDLLEISKVDIRTFALDFFLDGSNLSQWWPMATDTQLQMWLSTEREELEGALATLFDHWVDEKRRIHRKQGSIDGTAQKSKGTKSRASPKKGTAGRVKATAHRKSTSTATESDSPRSNYQGQQPPPRPDAQVEDDLTEFQSTNGSLPDIPYNAGAESSHDSDMDDLPTLDELMTPGSRWRQRQVSHTVEPQSPQSMNKGKQPERDPDSSYVVSQESTIGRAPLSPPPTRHNTKRRQVYLAGDEEMDDDSVVSPSVKRSRPHGGMQTIETNPSNNLNDQEDPNDTEISRILSKMSCPLSDTESNHHPRPATSQTVHNSSPSSVHTEIQQTDPSTNTNHTNLHQVTTDVSSPPVTVGAAAAGVAAAAAAAAEFDPFVDLSHKLQTYLQDCKTSTIRRANDQTLSPPDREKLHIRAGVLELLYRDVMSRIEAVKAEQSGIDKTDDITSYTLYA